MTQHDTIVHWGNSIIQHGHFNNRVYVIRLDPRDIDGILQYIENLAVKEGYTKIFVKVPESASERFSDNGYITEAKVPCFYKGSEAALFMAKYSDPSRQIMTQPAIIADVRKVSESHAGSMMPQILPPGFSLMPAQVTDANDIAALYRLVFETYPFPIFDPEFIVESMQGHVQYYIIKNTHTLAAVASCEIDWDNRNVEVTDFATNPLFRGRGFASALLAAMEDNMRTRGIFLTYTIARAGFQPINLVFASAGYQFGGVLPNNTNICGSMESMNVWYKKV
jgi:putative beta-lysine N-acetyltransferase